jgi:hypothetical protein
MKDVVNNGTELVIAIVGSIFVAIIAVKFLSLYASDNEAGMGKKIFWTVIAAIFIFSGYQVVNKIKDTANNEILTDKKSGVTHEESQ